MSRCRFFVYPSYYPEGVPRCVLQAMSVGRPIITCDSAGCRDTVVDGTNGYLVPIKNASAISDKMRLIIGDPDRAGNMGYESRKLAEKRFDVNTINQTIISSLV